MSNSQSTYLEENESLEEGLEENERLEKES